ncbi:MAG: hypothetical protein MPJ50_17120 [Pirellulales bacterium]|nr:hypothetical protein [Pirellulales bacterium]
MMINHATNFALWRQTRLQPRAVRWRGIVARCLALAIFLTAAQTLFAGTIAALMGNDPYGGLVQWDGWLYAHIAEFGYRSSIPPVKGEMDIANVAFFPGYPVAASQLSQWSGLSIHTSLLIVAQTSAAIFWFYVLLFLHRWNVAPPLRTVAINSVIVHPAAFFLVAAYSESLFLAALLGFLYWMTRQGPGAWTIAALHGFVMTGTRVAGLPLAMYPVFDVFVFTQGACWQRLRSATRVLTPCLIGAAGGVAFFVFCYWKFGHWDLYFQTQKIGWNVAPDYGALWKFKSYIFCASLFYDWVRWPDDLSRLSLLGTLLTLIVLACVELRFAKSGCASAGRRERVMLYLAALAILYIHAVGVSSRHMTSMIRYSFGCHVLLTLAATNLWHNASFRLSSSARRRTALGLLVTASVAVQALFLMRFVSMQWVA